MVGSVGRLAEGAAEMVSPLGGGWARQHQGCCHLKIPGFGVGVPASLSSYICFLRWWLECDRCPYEAEVEGWLWCPGPLTEAGACAPSPAGTVRPVGPGLSCSSGRWATSEGGPTPLPGPHSPSTIGLILIAALRNRQTVWGRGRGERVQLGKPRLKEAWQLAVYGEHPLSRGGRSWEAAWQRSLGAEGLEGQRQLGKGWGGVGGRKGSQQPQASPHSRE